MFSGEKHAKRVEMKFNDLLSDCVACVMHGDYFTQKVKKQSKIRESVPEILVVPGVCINTGMLSCNETSSLAPLPPFLHPSNVRPIGIPSMLYA